MTVGLDGERRRVGLITKNDTPSRIQQAPRSGALVARYGLAWRNNLDMRSRDSLYALAETPVNAGSLLATVFCLLAVFSTNSFCLRAVDRAARSPCPGPVATA